MTGPEGFEKTFAGKRDCETLPPVVDEEVPTPNQPAEDQEEQPRHDGAAAEPERPEPGRDRRLRLEQRPAGGIAGGLLLAGGGAVFLVKRRAGGNRAV
ncbi:hypothetical protein ACU686_31345 [Yinghuangia aomiensis]